MSALRLINETSATSVATLSVTDVFTSDFDIYKIVIDDFDLTGTPYLTWRLINSSGSVISTGNYDRAMLQMNSETGFGEGRSTNITYMNYLADVGSGVAETGGVVIWLFNPTNTSSYTFSLFQSSVSRSPNYRSHKGIGVLKLTNSITGFQLLNSSTFSFDSVNVKTYGLRVDNG
jgi:hypothetical protein